ncbi:hypothetical protein [Chengkuizengella axinellae]|uniref:DUF4367 domain-containing protein n=1 Tax=Chengkuizengella axinellae TaxID=3064388 RepID=A0ABT9IUM6_9BACL|nr:hypothetical protein [Chengkuizengella sp. 2205SS18-9]MDP5273012.1 hypothetical protein [Chengkuizengella sp. 2205SS18-9]
MKKIMMLSLILFLTACSGTDALEKLKKEYPESVKVVIEELPKEIQEKIAVPTKFPFEVTHVTAYNSGNPLEDPMEVINTEFVFSDGESVNMHLYIYHTDFTFHPDDDELDTVTLMDDSIAYYNVSDGNFKSIRWKKEEKDFSIMLVSVKDEVFSLEDLVEVVNSIEY